MTVSITLSFESYAAAAKALDLLATWPVPISEREFARIAHEDRPDVGVEPAWPPGLRAELIAEPAAFNPFAARSDTVTAVASAPIDAGAAAVPVPPPPSVPTPPAVIIPPTAATAPIAAPGIELDVHGLPWDQRIHADAGKGKPHPKIGDGSWRKKRGVEEATVTAVEAELRAAMGASAPVAAVSVPVPPVASVPVVPTVSAPPVVAPPAAAVPVPPTAASPDAAPLTFASLMARIAPPITKNPDSAAIALAILAPYGLTAYGQLPTVLQNDPPLFARIAGELTAALGVA